MHGKPMLEMEMISIGSHDVELQTQKMPERESPVKNVPGCMGDHATVLRECESDPFRNVKNPNATLGNNKAVHFAIEVKINGVD